MLKQYNGVIVGYSKITASGAALIVQNVVIADRNNDAGYNLLSATLNTDTGIK